MKKILIGFGLSLSLISFSFGEEITIHTESFVKDGKKWVKAEKVIPGTIVKYVNTISNNSDRDAESLIITNSIPKNMVYINKSAKGKGSKITYSINKGKTYDVPKNLKVKNSKNKKVKAKAADYTSIKWIIKQLNSGDKTEVSYKAKVK